MTLFRLHSLADTFTSFAASAVHSQLINFKMMFFYVLLSKI